MSSRPIENPLNIHSGDTVQIKSGGVEMTVLRIRDGIATCEIHDGSYPSKKCQVIVSNLKVAGTD